MEPMTARFPIHRILATASAVVLVACSGGSTGIGLPDGGGDPGLSASGSSTCNDVMLLGSSFDVHASQAAPPPPLGGTVGDGIWAGTRVELWGSTQPEGSVVGKAGGITWEVKGTTIQSVAIGASSGVITRRTLTLSTDAHSYALASTCDDPPGDGGVGVAQAGSYTATPTTLSLYVQSADTSTLEFTFTKQ